MNTFMWILFFIVVVAWSFVTYHIFMWFVNYYKIMKSFFKYDEFVLKELPKVKLDSPKMWFVFGNNTKHIYVVSSDEAYCIMFQTGLSDIKLKYNNSLK